MKHHFFIIWGLMGLVLLLAATCAGAQAAGDSLYGYSQVVIPGAGAARDLDASGNLVKKTADPTYRYFIYLTTDAGTPINPVEVWIKGKAYSARAEAITETPVVHTSRLMPQHPQKQVLVPKTTQNVVALIPIPLQAEKSSAKAKDLAQQNELVVVYKQAGRLHYGVLKELRALPAQPMQ